MGCGEGASLPGVSHVLGSGGKRLTRGDRQGAGGCTRKCGGQLAAVWPSAPDCGRRGARGREWGAGPVLFSVQAIQASCLLRNNVLLSHGLHLRGQASALGWALGLGPRAGTQGVGALALGTVYSFERGAQQTSI